MRLIAFDTETDLIRPGLQFPRVVCVSYAVIEDFKVTSFGLLNEADGLRFIWERLAEKVPLVNVEIAFDLGCLTHSAELLHGSSGAHVLLSQVFSNYDADLISDISNRQKLLDLASGCLRWKTQPNGDRKKLDYGLAPIAKRVLDWEMDKSPNTWRLRYSELRETPIEQWPTDAKQYAINDAIAAAEIWIKQEQARFNSPEILSRFGNADPLKDEFNQARSSKWLKLMSGYGLRTERDRVYKFAEYVEQETERVSALLADQGLVSREYKIEKKNLVKYATERGVIQPFVVAGATADSPPRFSFTEKKLRASGDFCLMLLSYWRDLKLKVIQRDPAAVNAVDQLIQAGLISMKFKRDTKAAAARMVGICAQLNRPVTYTKKKFNKNKVAKKPSNKPPAVALDKDACTKTGDPLLKAYAEVASLVKTKSADIPWLLEGARVPIHTHFENLQETGRTGSSGPNVQNVRRLKGIRECYVPRPGYVFGDGDFGKLELHAIAQICLWMFGKSRLAEVLNAGMCPHTEMAATIGRSTYEAVSAAIKAGNEEWDNRRNMAKVPNFGFPGGLGPDTLVSYAALGYGVIIDADFARELKPMWLDTWPEMRLYFDWINSLESYKGSGEYNVIQPWSGRLRGDATYCAACNSMFQGLGADVAKLAGWFIARACYVDRSDALFGCRPVNFPHDQFLIEMPEDRAHEACLSLKHWMCEAGRIVLPDCPVKADPLVCRRWSKHAKKILGSDGRLVPWEEKMAA